MVGAKSVHKEVFAEVMNKVLLYSVHSPSLLFQVQGLGPVLIIVRGSPLFHSHEARYASWKGLRNSTE